MGFGDGIGDTRSVGVGSRYRRGEEGGRERRENGRGRNIEAGESGTKVKKKEAAARRERRERREKRKTENSNAECPDNAPVELGPTNGPHHHHHHHRLRWSSSSFSSFSSTSSVCLFLSSSARLTFPRHALRGATVFAAFHLLRIILHRNASSIHREKHP